MPRARDAVEQSCRQQGWRVERLRDSPTFSRLVIDGPEKLLVDLAVDAAPGNPPTASFIGPTVAPAELAGRKLIALFDRAAARDFADVYALISRYSKQQLLTEAAALDAGFDQRVLAQMMGTLGRFTDADLPVSPEQIAPMRDFFADWQAAIGI